MKKILVVGSLNVDMVVRVPHMPVAGETILAEKADTVPGGKGANQAYAAGKLGAQTIMFGAVGNDRYAEIEKKYTLAELKDMYRTIYGRNPISSRQTKNDIVKSIRMYFHQMDRASAFGLND